MKKITSKYNIVKLLKSTDKEKTLKASVKQAFFVEITKDKFNNRFLCVKNAIWNTEQYFKVESKRTVNLEYITQKNIFEKKAKFRLFRHLKLKKFIT